MASLVVIEGPNRGAVHTLLPDSNRIGREPGLEVTLLDERASRLHAHLELGPLGWALRDEGSRNGTYVNGLRVEQALVQPGDELRVGEVVLLFAGDDDLPELPAGQTTMAVPLDAVAERASRRLPVPTGCTQLLGESPVILELQRQTLRAAASEAPVLITGESGTGKELVARSLHRHSPRRRGPFVAINGAVLRGELLESELFGHEKGAFTGAVARRQGAFELAHGGTLFLDEVAELPLASQAALLRVIEGQGFRRLGGGVTIEPDVRLVAATHQDLAALVAAGRFREDLRFRLDVVHLQVPPLREREGDVALLGAAFLRQLGPRAGSQLKRLTPPALAALKRYPFPGNVRELKNVIERLTIFTEGEEAGLADLPPGVRAAAEDVAEDAGGEQGPLLSLRDLEARHVRAVLDYTNWNKSRAASILGIDRTTLYAKIERYGLTP
jgi:DNA-binding NtrC family response regulator